MFYQIFLARLFSLVNCKAWHWNLGIGNGKGNGFGIGTVVTEAIISISIIVMESKLSRVVIQDGKSPSTKSRDTSICGHVKKKTCAISTFTRSMDSKLSRLGTQNEGTPPTSHVTNQNVLSSLSQGARPPNLAWQ